jgi:predicted transcriptional regulator
MICVSDIKTKLAKTNFNISEANIGFTIQPNGAYFCSFALKVVGPEQTSTGNITGSFRVVGGNISDYKLGFPSGIINSRVSLDNNSALWSFSIAQEMHPGTVYEIWGYYWGTYNDNNTGIYVYQLGIDWGTLVGYQETKISIDNRYHFLIESNPQTIENPVEYITELHWINSFVTGFFTTFKMILKSTQNIFLHTNTHSWLNASIGESLVIELKNNGTYQITGGIITPNWIFSNVTEFSISPNNVLSIGFTISSTAPLGSNGTIEIVTYEFRDILTIPIFVSRVGNSRLPDELSLLLVLFALLIVVGTTVVGYHQQDAIVTFFRKKKNLEEREQSGSSNPSLSTSPQVHEPNTPTWQEIQSRWHTILTDKEMTIIEKLFNHGGMNQRSIAEKMNVSKMTVSRTVIRLEKKGLVLRDRNGMSKVVRLNQRKL